MILNITKFKAWTRYYYMNNGNGNSKWCRHEKQRHFPRHSFTHDVSQITFVKVNLQFWCNNFRVNDFFLQKLYLWKSMTLQQICWQKLIWKPRCNLFKNVHLNICPLVVSIIEMKIFWFNEVGWWVKNSPVTEFPASHRRSIPIRSGLKFENSISRKIFVKLISRKNPNAEINFGYIMR